MVFTEVPSRDEINIKRLLNRCEEMSKQKDENEDMEWRLEKYIESLEGMINDINNKPHKPAEEVIASYKKRLNFLKTFLNVQNVDNPLDKMRAFQVTPKPAFAAENRDVEHSASESVHSEVRQELFSRSDNAVRKRTTFSNVREDSNDLDDILKYHHTMQEKIAENMLVLAKSIKEQSIIAGTIIRNDSSNVEKSAHLADKNIDHLKTQSEKLQENTRKTSQCWIWILIIIVITVFINMVLLMKMTRKKS